MNNSIITAMVSLNSMQSRLNVIADNIANMDTVGYKRKESSFEDVLTTVQSQHKDFESAGRATPMGYNVGYGIKQAAITLDWEQGTPQETGLPTDLAIEGNGLFAVQSNGNTAYTRDGAFQFVPDSEVDSLMVLVNNQGDKVLNREGNAPITVPTDVKVAIDSDGNVWATQNGTSEREIVAQVLVVQLEKPEGLVRVDGNKFVLADGVTTNMAFGMSTVAIPEDVSIHSGYLEKSNVDLTVEMAEMVQVQRAYQLMSRALTSSDTLMNLANNLRG
ncbi:flagellar hook-basal body protein [Paenibacillus crassostreae]|uniref:Flagellar biosynthesis protein FlgG n=1 Tax=Paenibacillus crassostreae TaxID=1763538 RepID=A0A167D923_9BACL|nr:flagellar hook-basal body protein [Paenibacillus crassostreae]AOZ94725.1 flagellar biosynthesis protein FlgG [Paenibacillus crassostreae]OAB74089.1 flagellar biosynthesis protein FlgG [Paenibacillus crassostreae]